MSNSHITKKCTKCQEIKSIDDFSKSNKDGYRYHCKQCCIEYADKYRKKNKTSIIEKGKIYYKEKRMI